MTALEVLTDAAENDFELFRICTLVRDLISPPVVKQIDEKHQRFNDVTYHKDPSGHYGSHEGIHRTVWQYYNGEIPEGYLIHHDDENPKNNASSNLVLKTKSEHRREHVTAAPIADRKPMKCDRCGKIFDAYDNGAKLHFCPECRAHAHYERKKFPITCEWCGKQFFSKSKATRYCSSACWGKAVSVRNGRHETKTCPICGKEFTARISEHKIFCSRKCKGEGQRRKNDVTSRH